MKVSTILLALAFFTTISGIVWFSWKKFSVQPSFSLQQQQNVVRHHQQRNCSKPNKIRLIPSGKRANAVIIVLARDSDLDELRRTVLDFEETFNSRYNYPYVFLNDKPFGELFKTMISQTLHDSSSTATSKNITYEEIPPEHWSYPEWIDQDKAAYGRMLLEAVKVVNARSESFRHMNRFFSGFFYKHPALAKYDYFWRLTPGARFYCSVDYDPFVFMSENKIDYGFLQMISHFPRTIPTLWNTTKKFLKEVYPTLQSRKFSSPVLRLFVDPIEDDKNLGLGGNRNDDVIVLDKLNDNATWNSCYFRSNFELGSFNFFRSPLYERYFAYLDESGGFFYELWDDAAVHSLAVAMFLEKFQIHHFGDMGYQHFVNLWCPNSDSAYCRCSCDPSSTSNMANFKGATCISKFLSGLK